MNPRRSARIAALNVAKNVNKDTMYETSSRFDTRYRNELRDAYYALNQTLYEHRLMLITVEKINNVLLHRCMTTYRVLFARCADYYETERDNIRKLSVNEPYYGTDTIKELHRCIQNILEVIRHYQDKPISFTIKYIEMCENLIQTINLQIE